MVDYRPMVDNIDPLAALAMNETLQSHPRSVEYVRQNAVQQIACTIAYDGSFQYCTWLCLGLP